MKRVKLQQIEMIRPDPDCDISVLLELVAGKMIQRWAFTRDGERVVVELPMLPVRGMIGIEEKEEMNDAV